jgi:hypothetical protein
MQCKAEDKQKNLLQEGKPKMIPKIIKRDCLPVICVIALMLIFLNVPTECYGLDIDIDVAPNTLNIQSQGQVVTVHTNIAYYSVVGATVTLNGIEISWWKADNQGNFVAKFEMSEVKALAYDGVLTVPGENELTLVGYTTKEEEFTGSQKITVIDVDPAGEGGQQ